MTDDERTVVDADPMSPAPLLLPEEEPTLSGAGPRPRPPAAVRPCTNLWRYLDELLTEPERAAFALHWPGCMICCAAVQQATRARLAP
jgi:hypothetical protein